jgi:hypothetical protein
MHSASSRSGGLQGSFCSHPRQTRLRWCCRCGRYPGRAEPARCHDPLSAVSEELQSTRPDVTVAPAPAGGGRCGGRRRPRLGVQGRERFEPEDGVLRQDRAGERYIEDSLSKSLTLLNSEAPRCQGFMPLAMTLRGLGCLNSASQPPHPPLHSRGPRKAGGRRGRCGSCER